MRAEIIAIGTELITGQTLDTNTAWLSDQLTALSYQVRYHTTVGDDPAAKYDAFALALTRADIIITTGGLGPTADDLTRPILAEVAGTELELRPEILAQIEKIFTDRGRTMTPANRTQAEFPIGAEVIPNRLGTAPGIWMKVRTSTFICLPGVQVEMKAMFVEEVLPRLHQMETLGLFFHRRVIHLQGVGESGLESKLEGLTQRGRRPEVGITASTGTITLRIANWAASPEEARQDVDRDAQFIYEKAGEFIFGEDADTLVTVTHQLLKEKRKTLATAESCTGGLVGDLLTNEPGISEFYLGGMIVYSNQAKQDLAGVPADLLEQHGAVSDPVARALAQGARQRFSSDLALGITGIAGPGGGTPEKPVGLVYIALACPEGTHVTQLNWAGERTAIKLRSAKVALNLVRLYLLEKLDFSS